MRTAFFGTSDFAATVLRRLAASSHRPTLVVTPPDRRQGRGRKVSPPPAAAAAAELGLELLQAESVNAEEARQRIAAAAPAAVAVTAFGQLIREPLLSDYEMLNVHPSLLPRWRGAAPIERAIMAGDERTGVCVMRLTAGLDSGPVALREEVAIGRDEDFDGLSAELAQVGGELLVRAFDLAERGELHFEEQPEGGVTYAEKIDPAERRLDPARPAEELAATVRALAPRVGVYLETEDGERLGVKRAQAVEIGLAPGDVEVADGSLLVGCERGSLRLLEVQAPGRRPMAAEEHLRGHAPPRRVALLSNSERNATQPEP